MAAGEGEADADGEAATVGGGFGDDAVAGEGLDEYDVHEHAEGIVPTCNVADEAQGLATVEHRLDVVNVPTDALDAAINVGLCCGEGLADFPHQQAREQVAMGLHVRERGGEFVAALGERQCAPGTLFGVCGLHGALAGGEVDEGQLAHDRAVDGRDGGPAVAGSAP